MDLIKTGATIITILMFLSNFVDSKRFINLKSTGRTSVTPLLSLLLNCSLWFKYGTLVEEEVISLVNGIGVICGIICLTIFWIYSIEKEATEKKIVYVLLFLCVILGYCRLGSNLAEITSLLGFLSAFCSILLFGSPLLDVAKVIRLKSTQGIINFPLLVLAFICSSLWTLIGFEMSDKNVIIPNFIGALLCSIQLAVFCYYNIYSLYAPVLP